MVASKKYFGVIVLIMSMFLCYATENRQQRFSIAFYNVENLYDSTDDPGRADDDFIPVSQLQWNFNRYNKKLNDLADVISTINMVGFPEIIGLCEIENKRVLTDLASHKKLKKANYQVIHFDGGDVRGIENAILYRTEKLRLISSRALPVKTKGDKAFRSRDILYAEFQAGGEKLHVFVNHWPSRNDGNDESQFKRNEIARILCQHVNSLLDSEPNANIVLLGDFNDEPDSESLKNILGANRPEDKSSKLVNLMYPEFQKGKGSYYYQRDWVMLDNIIVSQSVMDKKGLCCTEKQGFIMHESWMCYRNSENQYVPDRTYVGNNYKGGVSDHFPVYFSVNY